MLNESPKPALAGSRHPMGTVGVEQKRMQAQQDIDQLCINTIRTLAMDAV